MFAWVNLIYNYRMNKEFPEALITLQNSKQSEIPAFASEAMEHAKAELKRLND